ncbi:hypothetical protein [Helicobacter japonicus]|uniref:Uncharacterized protein n=1 Tax=Helicobacter japonicus TaxID=425400 RepID=A0A4U8TJX8_9HELI|nr:hypothetical protein [Helicobacter japonicus]TLE00416.1 hypothetical protein LS65_007960 [Helicobacter japonicus]
MLIQPETFSVLVDVLLGIFYALQWITYLFFGLTPPAHTNPTLKKHFYTLRLALPLRLLALFALYKIIQALL